MSGRAVLRTSRLVLAELETADLEDVALLLGDPRVMRHWPAPLTCAESEEWIARQQARYARDGYGYWMAREATTGCMVGQAGLMAVELPDGAADVGLGYIVRRERWRRGYAAEAAAACLDHAFGALGLARVVCLVRPENEPSIGVAVKLGLQRGPERLLFGFTHRVYVATPAAWRAHRGTLAPSPGVTGPAGDADAPGAPGAQRR
jgi:RimJ/RimL family protein N-acetyltransferase